MAGIKIEIEKVKEALPEIKVGLDKYTKLIKLIDNDVSTENEFQDIFNGFFRLNLRRSKNFTFNEFSTEYYAFMEHHKKDQELSFKKILTHFYKRFNTIEASFSSKLMAIIDHEKPIWDTHIINKLNLKKPKYSKKERLNKPVDELLKPFEDLYSEISECYKVFLKTYEANRWIKLFDEQYPNNGITSIKKIDFILWQIGKIESKKKKCKN